MFGHGGPQGQSDALYQEIEFLQVFYVVEFRGLSKLLGSPGMLGRPREKERVP